MRCQTLEVLVPVFVYSIYLGEIMMQRAAIAALVTGSLVALSGCNLTAGDNRDAVRGYEQGVQLAQTNAASMGSECESSESRLLQVGCRIGFSSFRYGQWLKRRSRNSSDCSSFTQRVNAVLRGYWQLPELTQRQASLVITTCLDGYARPITNEDVNFEGMLRFPEQRN